MTNLQRKKLLKGCKPDYAVYWHKLKGFYNIYKQGYVGIASVKNNTRFSGDFKGNYKSCVYFYNAIVKFGEENIETVIIKDGLSLEQANELELNYRPKPLIGWNIRQGGGNKGSLSKYTKLKISKKKKGKNKYFYNKIFTDESREKIRKSKLNNKNMLGKKHNEFTKMIISNSAKIRGVHINTILSRYKKVKCVESGIIYNSQIEAEKMTGISHKLISQVCTGRQKTTSGTKWEYVN